MGTWQHNCKSLVVEFGESAQFGGIVLSACKTLTHSSPNLAFMCPVSGDCETDCADDDNGAIGKGVLIDDWVAAEMRCFLRSSGSPHHAGFWTLD